MYFRVFLVLIGLGAIVCAGTVLAQDSGAQKRDTRFGNAIGNSEEDYTFFEEKVRPLLIEHCLDCHSVESEASGGLLLDSAAGWQQGGDSGPAIVRGKPDESLLLSAVAYTNPSLEMPPDGVLADEEIQVLREWIKAGAPDPRKATGVAKAKQTGLPVERATEHWAYRSIESPELDENNAIDFLIDGELEPKNARVAPAAPESALVRRVYFDLTGLPPTAADLDRYLSSTASDKYEALVDSLLASPRFGEHIARKWMDVARYAESITLRGFVLPEAWRYRDYLIRSFNADRPFDQMIREQLAGDLLAPDQGDTSEKNGDRLVATAFLAMGNTNLERQDKAQLEMDYIDEQLQTVGRAFLGQTIGCARCHDHKFDPIPTKDYYALAGIFKSATAMRHDNVSKWIEQPLPKPSAEPGAYLDLKEQLTGLSTRIKKAEKNLDRIQKAEIASTFGGIVVDGDRAVLKGAWRNSTSVRGYVGDGYLVGDSGSAKFLPKNLQPGTYEVRFAYTPFNNRSTKTRVTIEHDHGVEELKVDQTQRPKPSSPFHSLGKFEFAESSGCVTVFAADADGSVIADAVQFLPVKVQSQIDKDVARASQVDQDRALEKLELTQEISAMKEEEEGLKKQVADWPMYLTVVEENEPEDVAICIRGDFHNQGDVVPRGFLTAVQPLDLQIPSDESGRKQFAEWVTDSNNPLTARVYANRVWLWLMGRGIVDSPNNFGTTGMPPSHPALLDWLAHDLVGNKWSTKRLAKLIVMSRAYQRSADFENSEMESVDPQNSLYWRGHSRKLGVEALRDSMLQVSGELDLTMEGSILRSGTKNDYNYKHQSARRSVYQPVLRNSLPELFEVFDFADTSMSTGKRPRTTVAPQELALMNHPWVTARAEQAAEKYWKQFNLNNAWESAELELVVTQLYVDCLGRTPGTSELHLARAFLSRSEDDKGARKSSLQQLIHSLFASIDFRYLD